MLILLSPLALQVVPQYILFALRSLQATLQSQVISDHEGVPHSLRQVKFESCAMFSNLLHRMLRVNDSAHLAAGSLSNSDERQHMLDDWNEHVDAIELIRRELSCGGDAVKQILTVELPQLLAPATNPNLDHLPSSSPPKDSAAAAAAAQGSPSSRLRSKAPPHSSSSAEPQQQQPQPQPSSNGHSTITLSALPTNTEAVHVPLMIEGSIDKWADWLSSIPPRFPDLPPRALLWALSSIETAALKEITAGDGQSFSAWWVVRCWVDEWVAWLAERGGFLVAAEREP